jgi:hypothetical protein
MTWLTWLLQEMSDPRIIRFGFIDQENMFKEYPEQMGKLGGDQWLIFGGTRLWHAPEAQPRTYYPDRDPVLVQEIESWVDGHPKTRAHNGYSKAN